VPSTCVVLGHPARSAAEESAATSVRSASSRSHAANDPPSKRLVAARYTARARRAPSWVSIAEVRYAASAPSASPARAALRADALERPRVGLDESGEHARALELDGGTGPLAAFFQ
jgi:hypothetical protein